MFHDMFHIFCVLAAIILIHITAKQLCSVICFDQNRSDPCRSASCVCCGNPLTVTGQIHDRAFPIMPYTVEWVLSDAWPIRSKRSVEDRRIRAEHPRPSERDTAETESACWCQWVVQHFHTESVILLSCKIITVPHVFDLRQERQ